MKVTPFRGMKRRREEMLKRYSCVALDLPKWAKDILTSKMGSIEVSARDSFEIFLLNLNVAKPKYGYVLFSKSFVEIFEKKAGKVLEKIEQNRKNNLDFFVSNRYFWQEFESLFFISSPLKSRIIQFFCAFEEKIILEIRRLFKWLFRIGKRIITSGLVNMLKARLTGRLRVSLKEKHIYGNPK